MPRIERRYALLLIAVVLTASALLCLTASRRPLEIAYHEWRMSAAYNTIFGDAQPVGDGLASYDLTGVDIDAVLATYTHHRQALVDLGVLSHITVRLPHLDSDGTERQSTARSAFVHRMWDRFPGHKHYYLARDGTFETWAPVADESGWKHFLDGESHPP